MLRHALLLSVFIIGLSSMAVAGQGNAGGNGGNGSTGGNGGAGLPGKDGQPGMDGCPGGTEPDADGKYYLPGTKQVCNPA